MADKPLCPACYGPEDVYALTPTLLVVVDEQGGYHAGQLSRYRCTRCGVEFSFVGHQEEVVSAHDG